MWSVFILMMFSLKLKPFWMGEADCPSDDEFIQALIRSNVADSGAVVEMINRSCS